MRRFLETGFRAIALLTISPLVLGAVNLPPKQVSAESAPLQLSQKPPQVDISLLAEKQVVQKAEVVWQPLQGTVTIQPGEVLRYTITGRNTGGRPAKNLVVTQPIPRQMVYLLNSATASAPADITYSVDNGKSFTQKPTIQVKLTNGKVQTQVAPASAYTHIQWKFQSISPASSVSGSYQVRVR